MSVQDNLGLRDFDRAPLRRGLWLSRKAFREQALTRIADFGINCAGPDAVVRTLSGGNQQKLVIAREVSRKPGLLLAFQPTWSLDPGATRFVIDQILTIRSTGGAVLYLSAELEEVLMLGDRIGVLHRGRLVSEALHGSLGEVGAGFPQSPQFVETAWLPNLLPGTDLHMGILLALAAVTICHGVLWHTPFGFQLRLFW